MRRRGPCDESRRDNTVQNDTLQTKQFPTATFVAREAQGLPMPLPTSGELTFQLLGDMTAHGVTKPAVADLQAERSGNTIRVSGSIPVNFADWNIPNPSFGPISTDDHGVIEFLLVLSH